MSRLVRCAKRVLPWRYRQSAALFATALLFSPGCNTRAGPVATSGAIGTGEEGDEDGSAELGDDSSSYDSGDGDGDGDGDGTGDGGELSPELQGPRRLAGGTRHSCAVNLEGELKCWGSGTNGRLGYGNESSIGYGDTPADHPPVSLSASAVGTAAGFGFSCALLEGGQVQCWGATQALGYGNAEHIGDDESPASVGPLELAAPLRALEAGAYHACGLQEDGLLRCWGSNGRGQLGRGDTEHIGDDETPASNGPVPLDAGVARFGLGFDYTCALLEDQRLYCWGYGAEGRLGQLGEDNLGDDEPISILSPIDLGGPLPVDLSVGSSHVCALLSDASLRCWGFGGWGQLGYGDLENIGDDEAPGDAGPVPIGGPVIRVAAASHNTCALLQNGSLKCWGLGELGANGSGSAADIGDNEAASATSPVELGAAVAELTQGQGEHYCVRRTDEAVLCWGPNGWGQLGYGQPITVGDDETPLSVGPVPLD